MPVMEYDLARRYSPHNLTFPNYYVHERNVPLAYSQHAKADPRGYALDGSALDGSAGSSRGRPGAGSEELPQESKPARRRTSVACARCRKRKIRCSGDRGDGAPCTNCRQAGVDASGCQFHRVGSGNVHRVIDSYNMSQSRTRATNSNRMMPLYPAAPNSQTYSRSMTGQTYPQLDTESMYPSSWAIPYPEDTSPVDTYGLEPTAPYLTNPPPTRSNSMYGSTYRWTHPTSTPLHHASNGYYDQDSSYPTVPTQGHPYIQTNNLQTTAGSEALSPLNMASLSLTLPGSPHPRQYNMTDGAPLQRQLPMPQPSPAQTVRNVVDQLQDQRLRSVQVTNASSTGDVSAAGTASQPQFNFSSSSILDSVNAPAPATTYSTFRENRPRGSPSHLSRHSSQTSLYSFSPDSASKPNSPGDENNCTLVNGQRYTPLPHQQQQASPDVESLQRESFENRNVPLHRAKI